MATCKRGKPMIWRGGFFGTCRAHGPVEDYNDAIYCRLDLSDVVSRVGNLLAGRLGCVPCRRRGNPLAFDIGRNLPDSSLCARAASGLARKDPESQTREGSRSGSLKAHSPLPLRNAAGSLDPNCRSRPMEEHRRRSRILLQRRFRGRQGRLQHRRQQVPADFDDFVRGSDRFHRRGPHA